MLQILCRILFFLSMLVLYVSVTSTSIVIVIVSGYILCVFAYYYFNNVRGAIDECFNYCNLNATKFSDSMNPSQVSDYFVNRKYKMSNNGIGSLGGKKLFGSLCNPDGAFAKENSLFDSVGMPIVKPDFKNSEMPSPVLKTNNFSFRNNKICRDKLKTSVCSKDIGRAKNGLPTYNALNPTRRYNSNLDLETYMNVNSPGFTSRVVDKAVESASYHLKYPAVRQVSSYRFDKSTVRQLSKIPRVNSATTTTAAVRIATPEASSINSSPIDNMISEDAPEDSRNTNILQVLKDMSRKRNYSQEETDRSGSTPKKSRKNEIKNATTASQHKRAHEDSPTDSMEDECRKKRCDDTDRDIVKMMSYTSGLSVQGFNWESRSKKRKSSKLEKSTKDSPEKLGKFRKISDECVEESTENSTPEEMMITEDESTTMPESPEKTCVSTPPVCAETISDHIDEVDHEKQLVSFIDEDQDYVRVASGKILNRTNCTYRKKLNSKKIDPVSVISTEPEYVSETNYVDDKLMKENLLNSLVSDVERKEEENDSVIFYQNSIFEEMANGVVVAVEVHQPPTSLNNALSIKPSQPSATESTLNFKTSSTTMMTTKPKV